VICCRERLHHRGRAALQGRVSRIQSLGFSPGGRLLIFRYKLLFLLLMSITVRSVSQTPHKPPTSKPAENPQLYRNATFGFRYEIPYGWVDRTKDMVETRLAASQAEPSNAVTKENPAAKGEVLLATFERPPEAAGETINSAVVIAAENTANYPGLKKPEDYVGPLIEFVTKIGFKAEGDPAFIEVDGRELVRADFSKPLTDKVTMRQSTLVVLSKGRIVSFTFIAGTEDELDDLIDRLHFTTSR
jgi:hypothetical protein